MASRHVKHHGGSSPAVTRLLMFVALALATVSAGMAVHYLTDSGPRGVKTPAAATHIVQQPLSQRGRIIAVSPNSVTAESIDGFARTYVIDAQTNAITESGSLVGGAATAFAVDDEVAIVGVVRDGTAVATAVADKRVSNLDGPPMDGV